jgi:stage IV sporulation protein FB
MTTLVDCPESQRGTWSFRLFGTRVRVAPWFWITTLMLGASRSFSGAAIWVAVCFVSILLHEMGHVIAFRVFRRDAEVVLYGFGGLAIPDGAVDGTFPEVMVSFAGPLAGFCLAGLTAGAVVLAGGQIFTAWYLYLPHLYAYADPSSPFLLKLYETRLYPTAMTIVNDLLYVNFYWGMVNLLPVWPLDGGRISRALLEHWDRHDGRRKSLIVSALAAGAIALAALSERNLWVAAMFGVFCISSLQLMQGETRRAIPAYRRYRE